MGNFESIMFLRCLFGRHRVVDVPVAVVSDAASVMPVSELEAVQAALRHVEQKLRDTEAELEQKKTELEVANNSLQHVSLKLQSTTNGLRATDALLQKSQDELAKAAKQCLDTTVLLHGEQYKNEKLRNENDAMRAKLEDCRMKIRLAAVIIGSNQALLTGFLRQHDDGSFLSQHGDASETTDETASTPDPSENCGWEGEHDDEFSEGN